jgi:GT2 family glycosyltransferase
MVQKLTASVIVLGFNGRRYLDACLSSLLDQVMSCHEYEVLFAYKASTDGSADYVAQNYPSVRLIRFKENFGFAEGNNRAVPYARGQYITFLNQDTVVHKMWLSELVRAMSSHPEVKAVHSNMLMPWHPEFACREREAMVRHIYLTDLSRFGHAAYRQLPFTPEIVRTLFISGGSVMIDRAILDDLGYIFDPDFGAYCEDTDLSLRIHSLGYETALVPTSIVYHDQRALSDPDMRSLRKTSLVLKNRYLAYFKNMHASEFLLYLPFLLIGAPLKIYEFQWSPGRKLAYALASVPLAMYCLLLAMKEFPKYRRKRRDILTKRRRVRFWFLRELISGRQRRRALSGHSLPRGPGCAIIAGGRWSSGQMMGDGEKDVRRTPQG